MMRRAAMLAWVVMLCGLALPVVAQDRYQLTDEDWAKQSAPDPMKPEGQIQAIRRLMAEEKCEDAWEAASEWIDKHPNHPLLVQAYMLRGDAKSACRSEFKALQDYEQVIRQYPGSDEFNLAMEREFEIARLYSDGLKRKFLGVRLLGASEEAAEIYLRIQERAPGSALGEKASMMLGDHYYKRGEMSPAAQSYSAFIVNYPRSPLRERAMLRAIQSNLAMFKGPDFDATGLIEGGQRIRQYQTEYPAAAERIGADALLVRIDESMALKDYKTARWYQKRREKWAAVTMYQRVVRDHPRTEAAREAIDELGRLGSPVVAARNDSPGDLLPMTPATRASEAVK